MKQGAFLNIFSGVYSSTNWPPFNGGQNSILTQNVISSSSSTFKLKKLFILLGESLRKEKRPKKEKIRSPNDAWKGCLKTWGTWTSSCKGQCSSAHWVMAYSRKTQAWVLLLWNLLIIQRIQLFIVRYSSIWPNFILVVLRIKKCNFHYAAMCLMMSQILRFGNFTKTQKSSYLENQTIFLWIKKFINYTSRATLSRAANLYLISFVTENSCPT